MMDETQIVMPNDIKVQIEEALKKIKATHKRVGSIVTPAKYVEKKGQFDYVTAPYVKSIADKNYPGWSWKIITFQIVIVKERTEAIIVHGRLKWYESGLWREGDMIAAHRIQYKRAIKLDTKGNGIKGADGKWIYIKSDEIVDMGNDIKAGNADCMKKAFSTFLNISEDIYRAHIDDLSLNNVEVKSILVLARKLDKEEEFQNKIDTEIINKETLKRSINRLNELIEEQKYNDMPESMGTNRKGEQ